MQGRVARRILGVHVGARFHEELGDLQVGLGHGRMERRRPAGECRAGRGSGKDEGLEYRGAPAGHGHLHGGLAPRSERGVEVDAGGSEAPEYRPEVVQRERVALAGLLHQGEQDRPLHPALVAESGRTLSDRPDLPPVRHGLGQDGQELLRRASEQSQGFLPHEWCDTVSKKAPARNVTPRRGRAARGPSPSQSRPRTRSRRSRRPCGTRCQRRLRGPGPRGCRVRRARTWPS